MIFYQDISQLKDVNLRAIEDSISKLITFITKGEYTSQILLYFKNLLIKIDYKLKSQTLQNIKNSLLYLSSNSKTLSNDDMVDINIILSYINSKSIGISNLITSFAAETN
jgi:hypothetical protein